MNTRNPFYFLLILLISSISIFAQKNFQSEIEGTWEGQMSMFKSGKVYDSVDVRLTIKEIPDSNKWIWKTEYLSEKMPIVKDYRLVLKDKEKNIYSFDEGDGIELNTFLFGNKLYSLFETSDIFLTSTYELKGNKLIFEVTSGKKIEAESVDVTNYSVDYLQRVEFRRVQVDR